MKKIEIIVKSLICTLLMIMIYFSLFIRIKFNELSFDLIVYNLSNSKGANYKIVYEGGLFISVLLVISLLIIFIFIKYKKYLFKYNCVNKLFKFIGTRRTFFFILFITFSICLCCNLLRFDTYIKYNLFTSTLFEEHYVDGFKVNLEFPDNKRNLIYIYAESLESSNISKTNGGLVDVSYTPYLEQLGLQNINFSHNNKLGGAYQLNNTSWTSAALIAQTAGIPLKLNLGFNSFYGKEGFLPGAFSLGDILLKNGYKNYFMIGSDADIGERKDYFINHGNYTIYDYVSAKKEGYIPSDYYVWWGYEDMKLFEYAIMKLTQISKNKEPFNFTMLTVDTHFTDGYMDESCEIKFDNTYANSFLCSDSKINSFIKWIKEQDFYENTTIVISGDHLTMQKGVYGLENDHRNIYNVFINSEISPINEKNRKFSSFDMFPTTLASLGVKIENNKLGLGVNLFSNEKTLIEKYDIDYVNREILKRSSYYHQYILKK